MAKDTYDDGARARRFSTLMAELNTIVPITCLTRGGGPDALTFELVAVSNVEEGRTRTIIQRARLQTEAGTQNSREVLVAEEQTR